jgi:hypothetical protein
MGKLEQDAQYNSQTPDEREANLQHRRTQYSDINEARSPAELEAIRVRLRERQSELRRLQSVDFQQHTRIRIGALEYSQQDPPTADQMMFPERHPLSALMLYHHCGGDEFVHPMRVFSQCR